MKDYVDIIRKIWRREEPVTHAGKEINFLMKGPVPANWQSR